MNIIGSYKINNNKTTIPKEVFSTAGLPLEIGITGRSVDGAKIVPTSWCFIGQVKRGAVTYTGNNNPNDNEIIYDGGGVNGPDEYVYEGGGVS
jgi:hypothetical protein